MHYDIYCKRKIIPKTAKDQRAFYFNYNAYFNRNKFILISFTVHL